MRSTGPLSPRHVCRMKNEGHICEEIPVGEFCLVVYPSRDDMDTSEKTSETLPQATGANKSGSVKLLIAGVTGILLYFLRVAVTPRLTSPSVLQPIQEPAYPSFLGVVNKFWLIVNGPYVLLFILVGFVVNAIVKRGHPDSWISALLAGHIFAFIVLHMILHVF
jgi:hypothetical protein